MRKLKQAIEILEFNKIKQIIETLCASTLGVKKVTTLTPTTDELEVVYGLKQSEEALKIIYGLGEAPLGGVNDITEAIKRAKISAVLSAQELLDISRLLYAISQLKSFSERLNEIKIAAPIFHQQTSMLIALESLQKAINDCIDEGGNILDSASYELRNIRRGIQNTEGRIKERIKQIVTERRNKLTDGIVTIRNERYVVPVKVEAKNTFGGTIHDQSSSGNTFYIEPKEVVELNNKLQELHVEERYEIERILRTLTEEVKQYTESLSLNVDILANIDFMFAKGKYARMIQGICPKMNTEGVIRLVAARHPLIEANSVVANDLELGDEYTTIVITGPNTGGKTVTLKTVGLLTLMAQSGLLVPAHETSELAIFDQVFADIGDEQSIEQSLSTFSSRMTNIVGIIERLTLNSLVLFDELGAGTDPKEGASLAIAILDYVKERGARTIATSHYPELKAYAYDHDDVVNASVEFDVETLSPTYRLLVGVPGRSNAFEISKRLGLKENILQTARAYVETERTEMTDLITKLEDRGLELDQEIQTLQNQSAQVEAMKLDYERKLNKFESEKERAIEAIKKEAFETVRQAREEATQIVADLRQAKKEAALSIKDHELTEKLTNLKASEAKQAEKFRRQAKNKMPLKPGDEVMVLSLNRQGELVAKTKNNEWIVQLGMMKVNIKEADLEYVRKAAKKKESSKGKLTHKRSHVSIQLDLRGERYEDAMLRLDKYFDDALLAGYQTITIIHGHGTGALRNGVQSYLQKNKHVESFRFGGAGEGGTGATVVELK